MLRLPHPGDAVPPLMVTVRKMEALVERQRGTPDDSDPEAEGAPGESEVETEADEGANGQKTRQKRRKNPGEGGISWEHQKGRHRGGRRDRWRMSWMLGAGVALLLGISWWVVAILGKADPPPTAPTVADTPRTGGAADPEADDVPLAGTRSDSEILAEAEPLARRLMEVTSVDALLELVHQRERAEPRIRAFYPEGRIEAPGMAGRPDEVFHGEGFVWMVVTTRDFEPRQIAFIDGPDGLKVDWESYVGWSEMSWPDFIAGRPVEPKRFRVLMADVDYYNFSFTDDRRWRSYLLKSPDGQHVMYGYVERGSLVDERLRAGERAKQWNSLVELAFPPGEGAANQVLIEGFVTDGWIEVPEIDR